MLPRRPLPTVSRVLGVLLFIHLSSTSVGYSDGLTELATSQVSYLGYFFVPAENGFDFMEGGLSLAEGCLGVTDPSPSDGMPGCIVVSGKHQPAPDPVMIGAVDIVPPTLKGEAVSSIVVPLYDVTAGYPNDRYPEVHSGRQERVYEIYVVEEDGQCKAIHWWYTGFYAGDETLGVPTYGISDCNTSRPTVLGMWPVYRNPSPPRNAGADPLHPYKFNRGILRIPAKVANRFFDGYSQAFASGKQSGNRGESAGPSIAVRTEPAWSVPSACEISIKPLLYYFTGTVDRYQGFPRWYIKEQFRTSDGQQFTSVHRGHGGEIVLAGESMAYLQPIRRPYFCPECYPANDPDAGPDFCETCRIKAGTEIYNASDRVYQEKYRDHPNKYPNPDRDVITWYGDQTCSESTAVTYTQFPSFYDWLKDGTRAPMDCRIVDRNRDRLCNAGKGPTGLNYHTELLFYSIRDLAQAYRGEKKPYQILPYAELEITPDLSNDGYNAEDYCIGLPLGTTYDEERNLLYVGYGGARPFIQVFRIEAEI